MKPGFIANQNRYVVQRNAAAWSGPQAFRSTDGGVRDKSSWRSTLRLAVSESQSQIPGPVLATDNCGCHFNLPISIVASANVRGQRTRNGRALVCVGQ